MVIDKSAPKNDIWFASSNPYKVSSGEGAGMTGLEGCARDSATAVPAIAAFRQLLNITWNCFSKAARTF